jgi:hypothetical protein
MPLGTFIGRDVQTMTGKDEQMKYPVLFFRNYCKTIKLVINVGY